MLVRSLSRVLPVAFATLFWTSASPAYDYTAPVPFHTVANFDPSNSIVPFPTNLLLTGTTDLTLNIPVADPGNYADPQVALNALDGFSTTAPWSTTFSAPIDPTSLVGGSSVRVFEVTLSGPGGGVTGIVRELASPQEFVVALSPSDTSDETLAIVPTAPLGQMTSYMAVVTNGVHDASGAPVRASFVYRLAEGPSPLCVNGASTTPAMPASQACALEPLRQLVNSQQAAIAAAGIDPGSVALSWVATTESITPSLQAVDNVIEQAPAAATNVFPTGETLASLGVGLPPVADIYIGTLALPYYLDAPTADDPTAPLTGFWQAAPGAYVPPFDQFGLDPTSTNVTYANPLPVAQSTQVVPLLLTVPNANSGKKRPASGWPIVIFQHGITRNRTDMFAIAGTLAAQGFAVVAIDLPLHGITDPTNPFFVGNTPLVAFGAEERTFDLDLENNTTMAPGPDGQIDPSGTYFINLSSLLTSRDNLREGIVDLMELAHAIPSMSYSGGSGDFDSTRIAFVGQSLGSIVGTAFVQLDPNVNTAVLNVPGGGIARLLDASPAFGPLIHAGLAAEGVIQGTPQYDAFFVAAQTAVDSGDPINFAFASGKRLLMQEVIGSDGYPSDQVIPNSVPGAPLSGTEPLIAAFALQPISSTTQSADGIRGAVRFLQGEHGSLLDATDYPATTVEMQGEMASMIASDGTVVQVANPSIVAQPPPQN
ncbi:MAG: Ig-like domain-containing protein [Lysobacterales bacterium]